MTRHDLDVLFCNWPILWALLIWFVHIDSVFLIIFFALGYLTSVVYGFIRVAQQKWAAGRVIGWSFGLFFANLVFLPLLYWLHLRKQQEQWAA